jgi:hypothetical protein
LQALGSNSAKTHILQVLSYHSGTNKGGGLFVWSPQSTSQPDNCTIFAASGVTTGRWTRQLAGALDATMCGAWWDNSHDDAAALTIAFHVAALQRRTLTLPGGIGKVCSPVTPAAAVIVRGQGMGAFDAISDSPTLVDGSCMKSGWVFDLTTSKGSGLVESPKYYDMSIKTANNAAPGGCIRWNTPSGGFTDDPSSQHYMMNPYAARIFCHMQNGPGNQQIGFECSKCFDGDFSQNNIVYGKTSIALEGSDVMCIGCAGPNRVSYSSDALIRLASHGTFGNMDRVVGNEILYPSDNHQRYDAFIYDASRSSTIESNHIEGIIAGVQSAIHVLGGFSHAVTDNDIDVLTKVPDPAPHWLVAEGPFVNFRAFNNGAAGVLLGPAYFNGPASQPNFNLGGVRQIITHGGNASNGDSGFPNNGRQ